MSHCKVSKTSPGIPLTMEKPLGAMGLGAASLIFEIRAAGGSNPHCAFLVRPGLSDPKGLFQACSSKMMMIMRMMTRG